MLSTEKAYCPYCGERIEVVINCSVEQQEYIEDCFVCCRPIVFSIDSDNGELVSFHLSAEND